VTRRKKPALQAELLDDPLHVGLGRDAQRGLRGHTLALAPTDLVALLAHHLHALAEPVRFEHGLQEREGGRRSGDTGQNHAEEARVGDLGGELVDHALSPCDSTERRFLSEHSRTGSWVKAAGWVRRRS
jgi:hypothetical protein